MSYPVEDIDRIVGVPRHETQHIARAVSDEQTVYISHPDTCSARLTLRPLTECRFSRALDNGIDLTLWEGKQDAPMIVKINAEGRLIPFLYFLFQE